MLKQMRERTKTILWIVVVAFVVSIFAVWGMNLRTPQTRRMDKDAVGSLNGEVIYRRAYSGKFQELLNQVKMQKGEDYKMNASEYQMLANQAWELLIQQMLLAKEIKKLDITITDDELVSFLRRNPHPSLQDVFKKEDGKFDYQAYLKALNDPSMDWTELEAWGRSILPGMKLEGFLSAQINIPEREILERFEKESAQVKASYIEIPFEKEEPPYEPTEEEITGLYEEIKGDFEEFEKRRIRVIEIEKKPTELDEQDVRDRLREIREEIVQGEDFAESAKNYSDDFMSAQNGGDLGFFGKGDMVPEFEEVAFSLKEGEISEPVRTEFGYHIIKLEEKKTENNEEKIRASHILMEVDPGYDTIDSLKTLIQQLIEGIKDKGFERSAEELGLTVKNPPPFSEGSFIKDLGYLPRIVNFAFNYNTGDISSPIESENSIYIVKNLEKIPERTKPLDEVRPQLIDRIRRKREEETAGAMAQSIRQEALTSGDLEAIAHSRELELKETELFKETDVIPGIGGNTAFAKACHQMSEGELSVPIKGRNAYYIIRLTERTEPDMSEFANRRNEILNQLRSEMASYFMAGWYDVIRKNAEVVDLRESTLD